MERPIAQKQVFWRQTKWGKVWSDHPPKVLKGCCVGAAAFVYFYALMCVFLVFVPFDDAPGLFLLWIILAGAAAWFGTWFLKAIPIIQAEYEAVCEDAEKDYQKQLAKVKRFEKEHPHFEDEQLYLKAKKAGIKDVESKANVSRLVLWAKNNGIKKTQQELLESYNIGKSEVEQADKKQLIKEMKAREKADETEYTKFVKLTGRAKSARIIENSIDDCHAMIAACQAEIDDIMNEAAGNVVRNTQRESSWATHGGIAAGIAGGAAGVAVALDTERRNQEKRQFNAELYRINAQLAALKSDEPRKRIREIERELDRWQREKEKNKLRLTEKIDESKLLDGMKPRIAKFENSPTGAVRLTLELQPFSDLLICDNVKAVVDGSIEVSLLADGEVIGTAIRVLPYQGITRMQKLECICRNIKKQNDKYEFSFKPIHLWAVENN